MIQPLFNGMLAILLVKFCLNDLPHAAGLSDTSYDRPPTRAQLRYIAGLRQRLKMTITYERQVVTFGEAGRMIRELEAEDKYRKRLEGTKPVPTGSCYPDAWRYVIQHTGAVLVHGTATTVRGRIYHGWVELPDGTVWEPYSQEILPIERYHELVDPVVEDRYTAEEAAIMVARTGNHGPWTEEERSMWLSRTNPGNPYPPRKGVIPKLPEEARGDILFFEYIRDLCKYEALSEEDAQRLWEGYRRQHYGR